MYIKFIHTAQCLVACHQFADTYSLSRHSLAQIQPMHCTVALRHLFFVHMPPISTIIITVIQCKQLEVKLTGLQHELGCCCCTDNSSIMVRLSVTE